MILGVREGIFSEQLNKLLKVGANVASEDIWFDNEMREGKFLALVLTDNCDPGINSGYNKIIRPHCG